MQIWTLKWNSKSFLHTLIQLKSKLRCCYTWYTRAVCQLFTKTRFTVNRSSIWINIIIMVLKLNHQAENLPPKLAWIFWGLTCGLGVAFCNSQPMLSCISFLSRVLEQHRTQRCCCYRTAQPLSSVPSYMDSKWENTWFLSQWCICLCCSEWTWIVLGIFLSGLESSFFQVSLCDKKC